MNTAGGPVRSEGGGELATWGGWLVRIEGEGGREPGEVECGATCLSQPTATGEQGEVRCGFHSRPRHSRGNSPVTDSEIWLTFTLACPFLAYYVLLT